MFDFRHRCMRPWFGISARERELFVLKQASHDSVPTKSENADQTKTTTFVGFRRRCHRFVLNGWVRMAAYRQQPPGGDRQCQPQPLGSLWIVHTRVLPLP